MTVYQLAEKYQVQRQAVSKHLHTMGVTMRQQGLSEEQVGRAVELYVEERLTLKQVGAKLGVHAGTGAVGAVAPRSEDAVGGGEASGEPAATQYPDDLTARWGRQGGRDWQETRYRISASMY